MDKQFVYPKVLLVGRTNVGKSTLFNRLVGDKKSIVFEREGVTRDHVHEIITWDDRTFDLVDTGGLSFDKHLKDDIWDRVQEKVMALLVQADLIFLVCDGKNGMTDEDRVVARMLHKSGRQLFLLVNKADNVNAMEENLPEFNALGIKTIIPVSAIHGIGIATLLDAIVKNISVPEQTEIPLPDYKVAIIGKPNVGKSSLMNLLIKQERSIVSDVPGTTREAISENIYYCRNLVEITDTAGVRRKARVTDDLEELMVKSSFQAVRDSNIVLVMLDASMGEISAQELKLLFYAFEDERKPIIVVFNKLDLITDEYTRKTLESNLSEYNYILRKIPQVWTSCLTKKNVWKILHEIKKVWKRCNQEFNTTEVDEFVKSELLNKPLYHSSIQLRLFKIRHVKASVPTFILHVNHPEWFETSELGCIENILRGRYDLQGCPVRLIARRV